MILFGCGNVASLRLQLILARHLREKGHTVAFLIWGDEDSLSPYRKEVGSLAECYALGTPPPAKAAPQNGNEGRILQFRDYHRTAIELAKAQIQKLNPSAVLVSEDGVSANLHFMQAAKELSLRIIDVPYGYGFREDLEADLADKERQGNLIRPSVYLEETLRNSAPQWIKTRAFAGATIFRAEYAIGAWAAWIDVPNPWSIHGGLADVLCVESQQAMVRYEADGIPPSKMRLSGSPYCDHSPFCPA
ncbi:MAG: hypothetical protein EOQ41_03025 [Mesorhizobium sp.]|uniref:hypothetical protein n=1 Tax=Mesorhizobium sp. TaxID=1871066 RepID=UPI000FE99DF6|nr:hypothetical protein [Mesorhizobium sp.]RWB35798.1 MAG: hypothetical protein EOQ41_03025 [Mesorhizobium sp.]